MKIAFVQPRSFHTWEAINIGYLASYLREKGYQDLAFFSGFFDSDDTIIQGCRNADIIGFSCTSPQMAHALKLAARIKRQDNYIVFGGAHPSALSETTIANEYVDAVVVGEGEQAFLDIVEDNRNSTVRRPYLEDLDSLPFPDRRLIKQERNISKRTAITGKKSPVCSVAVGVHLGALFAPVIKYGHAECVIAVQRVS